MQRGAPRTVQHGKPVEHQRRAEHQHERARHAADEAQQQECRHGVGQRHRRGGHGTGGEAAEEPGPASSRQMRQRHEQGAREVAEEVGRGDQAGGGFAQAERRRHVGQDRRVDEASDPHARGKRQHAAERHASAGSAYGHRQTAGRGTHERLLVRARETVGTSR